MDNLFSGITAKVFANPADVSQLKCWRADDIGDVWFHGHKEESKITPRFRDEIDGKGFIQFYRDLKEGINRATCDVLSSYF